MKGIGGGDLIGNRFGATTGSLGLGCLFKLASECVGDVSDFCFVGKRFEEPLAQNVINLVGSEVNRGDVPLCATKLLACIVERPSDQGAAALIGCVQIRDHHADIGLFPRCGEQVREGTGRDIGDSAGPYRAGCQVLKIRRQFIQ